MMLNEKILTKISISLKREALIKMLKTPHETPKIKASKKLTKSHEVCPAVAESMPLDSKACLNEAYNGSPFWILCIFFARLYRNFRLFIVWFLESFFRIYIFKNRMAGGCLVYKFYAP